VAEEFRGYGLSKQIKKAAFNLSRQKYPQAKLLASLPVGGAEDKLPAGLPAGGICRTDSDEEFWRGCQSCTNYDILLRTSRKLCLCTGMLYDPAEKLEPLIVEKVEDEKAKTKAKSSISL